jgi:hypothetical protein
VCAAASGLARADTLPPPIPSTPLRPPRWHPPDTTVAYASPQ